MTPDRVIVSVHQIAAAFVAVAALFSGIGFILGRLAASRRPR